MPRRELSRPFSSRTKLAIRAVVICFRRPKNAVEVLGGYIMSGANGMWDGLMDFSFRKYATPKMLKVLYAIHLLGGLIAAVAYVVLAFQQAPVRGLLALLGALAGYALWILYCRVALEV